jgi:hypothetical protein
MPLGQNLALFIISTDVIPVIIFLLFFLPCVENSIYFIFSCACALPVLSHANITAEMYYYCYNDLYFPMSFDVTVLLIKLFPVFGAPYDAI